MENNDLTIEEMIALGMLDANAMAQPVMNLGNNQRSAAINAAVASARANFNRNFRNEVTALGLNSANQERAYMNMMLQESKNLREAGKASANAGLYNEAKAVLMSEDGRLRQSVLKTVALEDMIIEERIKLAHAKTDEERRVSATKIYNAQKLKDELDAARHRSEVPTAEQNARFTNLTRNVNFNAIPYSLYPRLVGNNRKNAATKIQSKFRGYKTRKQYKPNLNRLRAARQAEKARQEEALAALPMVPLGNFGMPKPQGYMVGGPNAPAAPVSAAERRRLAAEAAAKRFAAKKPNQGGKRRTQRKN
jgi:hypothetical protein